MEYSFRSNRSTSLTIIDLIENITSMLDQRKNTIGIFIYLKKVLNTIDYEILLNMGLVNNWLYIYKGQSWGFTSRSTARVVYIVD